MQLETRKARKRIAHVHRGARLASSFALLNLSIQFSGDEETRTCRFQWKVCSSASRATLTNTLVRLLYERTRNIASVLSPVDEIFRRNLCQTARSTVADEITSFSFVHLSFVDQEALKPKYSERPDRARFQWAEKSHGGVDWSRLSLTRFRVEH